MNIEEFEVVDMTGQPTGAAIHTNAHVVHTQARVLSIVAERPQRAAMVREIVSNSQMSEAQVSRLDNVVLAELYDTIFPPDEWEPA